MTAKVKDTLVIKPQVEFKLSINTQHELGNRTVNVSIVQSTLEKVNVLQL